ncbi:MAG: DUF2461 domain-containing protein [bacterium]
MITQPTIKFLRDLKKNNSKDWFDTNRARYELAKSEYLLFVEQVLNKMKTIDPTLQEIEPKQCVFRINRDVRFSKNKEPYKTNFGASFSKGGKKIQCAGYYFHLEPGQSFIGGGFWMPMAPELKKIRMEIDYNLDEFKAIINNKSFKKYFTELNQEEKLSRPPQGYDLDNPALELLKLKSFIVSSSLTDAEVLDNKLVNTVVANFTAMKPLIDFLNRAID